MDERFFLGRARIFFAEFDAGGNGLVVDDVEEVGLELVGVGVRGEVGVDPLAVDVDGRLDVLQLLEADDVKLDRALLAERGGAALGERLVAEEIEDDEARAEQQHQQSAFTAGQGLHF